MSTDSVSDPVVVAPVQEKLSGLGLLNGAATPGQLDVPTRQALASLQCHAGMAPTGELDQETHAVLEGWTCGTPLTEAPSAPAAGGFIAEFTLDAAGPGFNKTDLTYRFDPLPAGWDAADIIGGINQAMQFWSTVTPLRFTQKPSGADIRFRFDGLFDQPGGGTQPIPVWANAAAKWGQISFNPGVTFTSSGPPLPAGAADIVNTAAHELGHLLGLDHSTNPEAVMYPSGSSNGRGLCADDIEGMQQLYGGPAVAVTGWFGDATSGADVALADFQVLPLPSRLDILVAHIDNPPGADQAYYRVGWDVDPNGFPRRGWSPIVPMGGPLGHDSQGLALTVGHIDGGVGPGGAVPDLVMVWMDNPGGENNARYRVGFNPDSSGLNATWSADMFIPGPWGNETAGMAAALWDLTGSGRPDLIVAWIDAPDGADQIFYKIGFDLDTTGATTQWSPRLEVGPIGHASAGLGIAVTDLRGNGRPDMVVFWIDDPDEDNAGWVRVGRDLDAEGKPASGFDLPVQVPGWWGTSTCGGGAALGNLRGLLRPDLVVLNLDAPEGEDRAHYRVLSPPLPTWNLIRNRGTSAAVQRVAAISPSASVVLVACRAPANPVGAPAPIELLVWDQTDLNENQGSDILEFVTRTIQDARADSPVALASRGQKLADVFWFGSDDLVHQASFTDLGTPGTPATGPTWPTAGTALPNSIAARSTVVSGATTVPGSPLAAASVDGNQVAVFFAGREDDLIRQRFTQAGGWGAAQTLARRWPRPITAIAAEVRDGQTSVFWVDGVGDIWECSVDAGGNAGTPSRIPLPLKVDPQSNLVAVSRKAGLMDLFWIEPANAAGTGRVLSASFNTGTNNWTGPIEVSGSQRALLPGYVAAVNLGGDRLQVFWVEADRSVWSSWFAVRADGTPVPFCPPVQVAPPGSARPGREIAAVARLIDLVRLFFVGGGTGISEVFYGQWP